MAGLTFEPGGPRRLRGHDRAVGVCPVQGIRHFRFDSHFGSFVREVDDRVENAVAEDVGSGHVVQAVALPHAGPRLLDVDLHRHRKRKERNTEPAIKPPPVCPRHHQHAIFY